MRWGIAAPLGALLGLCEAVAVGDGLGVPVFEPGAPRFAVGLLAAVALGAAQGGLVPRALPRRARSSLVLVGAACAAFIEITLARAWTPWIDLSVFGAGPGGRVALLVLPFIGGLVGVLLARLP